MISVKVNNRKAQAVPRWPLTTGSVGMTVDFVFSSEWDGLTKTAVFRGSGVEYDQVISGNSCVVPHEVLATAGGELYIGVYGANGSSTIVIPTVWANAGHIYEGTERSEVDPSDPTPSWADEVQAIAEGLDVSVSKVGSTATITVTKYDTDSAQTVTETATISDGEVGIFDVEWNVTTNAQIEAAYQAGKAVRLVKSDTVYWLSDRVNDHKHIFTAMGDSTKYLWIKCESDVWNSSSSTLAPKASPAFTGTPTAPTAAAGTNTTQIATTAFVKNAVDNTHQIPSGGSTGQVLAKQSGTDYDTAWVTNTVSILITYTESGGVVTSDPESYVAIRTVFTNLEHSLGVAKLVLSSGKELETTNIEKAGTPSQGIVATFFDGNTAYKITHYSDNGFQITMETFTVPTCGVPSGGSTNQVLKKLSGTDYDIGWANESGGGGGGSAFWATYGTTTSAEIEAAFQAGEVCLCTYGDNIYELAYRDSSTNHSFICVISNVVYYVRCTSDSWTNGSTTLANASSIPGAATATPSDLGTAAVGTSLKFAKEDHVHDMPSAADVGAVASNQGVAQAGKWLKIDTDGSVIAASLPVYNGGVS